jgi:Uma2 family endonuclease
MMTPVQEQRYYTPEEYLELELNAQERHEYIDGEVICMTGGTPNHNQIALNLSGTLNLSLKRQPYRVFVTDQRLWIPKKQIYTYPDVMVVEGELQLQDGRRDTITNPLIIAEVLSESTQGYDRGEQFAAYRTVATFQEYVLIDQTTLHVEHYYKTEPTKWIFSEYDGDEATVSFASIPFEMTLIALYDKVEFS